MARPFYGMSDKTQPPKTPDQRVAEMLQVPPEHVKEHRRRWQGETVIRAVLADRIRQQIAQRDTTLRIVEPEGLKKVQGEITGLELALALVTQEEK